MPRGAESEAADATELRRARPVTKGLPRTAAAATAPSPCGAWPPGLERGQEVALAETVIL